MTEQFGSAMIERFATEHHLQYSIDQDGDVCMSFFRPGTETDGGALTVWIGSRVGEFLVMHGVLAISDAERADLLEWSNAWNLRNPWPTLRLAESCDGTDRHVVTAGVFSPVRFGTPYEAVASMCMVGVMAIHVAWKSFGDWIVDPRTREAAHDPATWPPAGGETRPGGQADVPWTHDFRPVGAEGPDHHGLLN